MDIKMLIKRHVSLIILLLLIIANPSYAVNAPNFSLNGEDAAVYNLDDYRGKTVVLFFFAFSCSHCERAMPVIKEIYKKSNGRYQFLGIVYGTSREDLKYKKIETGTNFPVAVGTEALRMDYKVNGTPYFWVIGPDGAFKERFFGEKGAEFLKEYLETDNLNDLTGLFEIASEPGGHGNKDIKIAGQLVQASPSYFPRPSFVLTNGFEQVRVSSWLPLEVAPAPKGFNKQRKKVMSDLIGKYVIIEGKVKLEDGRPFIEVKNAKSLD